MPVISVYALLALQLPLQGILDCTSNKIASCVAHGACMQAEGSAPASLLAPSKQSGRWVGDLSGAASLPDFRLGLPQLYVSLVGFVTAACVGHP